MQLPSWPRPAIPACTGALTLVLYLKAELAQGLRHLALSLFKLSVPPSQYFSICFYRRLPLSPPYFSLGLSTSPFISLSLSPSIA